MKYLILILSLLVTAPAFAQGRKIVDLRADLGLLPTMSQARVSDVMTLTAAKAKYPEAYQRALGLAWGDAKFMSISMFDVCMLQAEWAGKGGASSYTGYLDGQNHVEIPEGNYYVTVTGEFSSGEIRGKGCGYTDVNGTPINTKLSVWHENWQGDPQERNILQTSAWGGIGNATYLEAFSIAGVRFDGRQLAASSQSFNSIGLRLWKPGELGYITDVWFENFRTHGVLAYNPTPFSIGRISVFQNVQGGVVAVGAGLGTMNVDQLSGDSNGMLFATLHYGNETGGGQWNINSIKFEEYGAEPTRVHRDMIIGHLEGQVGVHIGSISCIAKNTEIATAFVVDTRSPVYPPQNASIHVGSIKSAKIKNMVWQIPASGGLTGHAFAARGNNYTDGFSWSSYGGGSFNWNVTAIPVSKVAHSCTTRITGTTGCTAYRYIIDGPPRVATTQYVGDVVTPPPPPPPTPCSFTYSAWSNCTGTQTRTATSSPSGCTGTPPADSLSRSCTVAPPPPPSGAGFNPADVLVVWNSAEPATQAVATAYATAWGIPAANIMSVNLGTADEAPSTGTLISTAKSAIDAKAKQITVLTMPKPSRLVNGQSITSAIQFGVRSTSALTVSPLYNYSGLRPRADKGSAQAFLLISPNYIRKDADGTRPTGTSILLLAKDVPSQNNPRGSARAGQTAASLTVWDNRSAPNSGSGAIGGGNNPCNYISSACWLSTRKITTPVVAAYQSMDILGDAGTTAWAKGFYGDHVTSFGGYLPPLATGYNAKSQTPLTYELDKGASLSVGSVSEPWQGAGGSLAQQFVNASIFHPLFIGGKPVGAAAYAAVQCPDRMLFAGDPLCAPFK